MRIQPKLKWILISSCVIAPTVGVSIWAMQASYKADIEPVLEEPGSEKTPSSNSIKFDISIPEHEPSLDGKLDKPEKEKIEVPTRPDQTEPQLIPSIEQDNLDSIQDEYHKVSQAHVKSKAKLQDAKDKLISFNEKLKTIEEPIKFAKVKISEAQIKKDEANEKLRVIEIAWYKQEQNLEKLSEWPQVKKLQINVISMAIKEIDAAAKCIEIRDSGLCAFWQASQDELEKAKKELANVKTQYIGKEQKIVSLTRNSKPKTTQQLQDDLNFAQEQYNSLIQQIATAEQELTVIDVPYQAIKQDFEQAANNFAEINSSAASDLNIQRLYVGNINYYTKEESSAATEIEKQKTKLGELEEQLKFEDQ